MKANPANKILNNGDWMFSQSRSTSSEWGDHVVLGTAKLRHRKSILWPTTRGRDVSKRIMREFTIFSNEIQFFVIRNSKLAGPRRSASQWTSWHRKISLIAHQLRSLRGRTEAQKEYFIAHNARRRCLKKNFEGIHDRFLKDSTYRDSQLKIRWTEETCIAMDKLAQENHSYCPLPEEFERYRKNWYITLNTSGRNALMKLRSNFNEALTNMP